MAGGTEITNDSYYLYAGESWLTLSPYDFNPSAQDVFVVGYQGRLEDGAVFNPVYGVRPAIVLANDLVVAQGMGTSTSPYELVLE